MRTDEADFGTALRGYRKGAELSLRQLGKEINFNHSYLGNIENGRKPPTYQVAAKCDAYFGANGALLKLVSPPGHAPKPAQLPDSIGEHFVGRVPERSLLDDMLASCAREASPAVIAVDGPPGIGKTSLAILCAHAAAPYFPDGHLYVDLLGHTGTGDPKSPEAVLETFLLELGLVAEAIPAGLDRRAALYRSILAVRRVLVLLDNAENYRQVQALLPGTGACAVLITSRARMDSIALKPHGARIALDSLSHEESVDYLRIVLGERSTAEPEATEELARRCAYLPLALALAVGGIVNRAYHSVGEVADGLRRHGLLQLAVKDDPQRALRAVFLSSYDVLSEDQQRMFRRLALHPGELVTVETAAVLADCATDTAAELLDDLHHVHLVDEVAPRCYRHHDAIGQFAHHLLNAADDETTRSAATHRLCAYYLHASHRADLAAASAWRTPMDLSPSEALPLPTFNSPREAQHWYATEADNLIAVLRLAHSTGLSDIAWRIPLLWWSHFLTRWPWSLWASSHALAIEAAIACGDRHGEAWVTNNLAFALRRRRCFADSRSHYLHALKLRQDNGDVGGQAWTLIGLAYVAFDEHHNDETSRHVDAALKLFQQDGDRHGRAIALGCRGEVQYRLGNYTTAITSMTTAAELLDNLPHADANAGRGRTLASLTRMYLELGHLRDAEHSLQQCYEARKTADDAWGKAETTTLRGQLLHQRGDIAGAIAILQRAHDLWAALDDPRADDVADLLATLHHKRSA